jgi:hypothetical protein
MAKSIERRESSTTSYTESWKTRRREGRRRSRRQDTIPGAEVDREGGAEADHILARTPALAPAHTPARVLVLEVEHVRDLDPYQEVEA